MKKGKVLIVTKNITTRRYEIDVNINGHRENWYWFPLPYADDIWKAVQDIWYARTKWIRAGYDKNDGDVMRTGYYVGEKVSEMKLKDVSRVVVKDLKSGLSLYDDVGDNLHCENSKNSAISSKNG